MRRAARKAPRTSRCSLRPGPRLEGLSPEQLYHLPQPQLDALAQQADLDKLTKEQRGILFLRYPQQR